MNRMDMRMMADGRNPYGSRGGYVSSRRMRRMARRDRAMGEDYAYNRDYRGNDYAEYGSMRSDRAYSQQDNARGRRDYESNGQSDMARMDYGSMRDMHYGERQGNFKPVEAMGYFTGYYGGGDYGRGGRRDYGDYNYDMRGRRDYGYDMGYDYRGRDYGYDYGSEMLDDKELEHWAKKLEKEVEEPHRHLFSKDNIKMKAEQMGIKFDKFSLEEYMVAVLMMYTDYCKTLGTSNMDVYFKLAKDWLCDEDVAVQYGEKLASYYDNIVDPE